MWSTGERDKPKQNCRVQDGPGTQKTKAGKHRAWNTDLETWA